MLHERVTGSGDVTGAVLLLTALLVGTGPVVAAAQPVQIRLEPPSHAQSPNLTARVSITDEEGNPYFGLREEQIQVTLDGRLRDVSDMFGTFDSARLGVLFVVDQSGSIGESPLRRAFKAIRYFSASFSPQARTGLLTFNEDLHLQMPMETSYDEFESRLEVAQMKGNTALYDAVQRGIEMLESADVDHRALVLFSDGKDTRSTMSAREVTKNLQPVDWPLYAVGTGDDVNPRFLRRFASITGGEYVKEINGSTLSSLYEQFVRPLEGHRYVLKLPFKDRPTRAMHRMEVEVRYQGNPYSAAILFSNDDVPEQID